MDRIVLASASPRRADLLRQAGIAFEVDAAGDVDESVRPGESPAAAAERLAREKAAACLERNPAADVAIGADTMVVLDGRILGKPRDAGEAAAMLRDLAGRKHEVVTGFAVLNRTGEAVSGAEVTEVWMRALGAETIAAYVESGEPLDKAGAYGIQGRAALFVERIHGDYATVVGLPLARVGAALERLGLRPL